MTSRQLLEAFDRCTSRIEKTCDGAEADELPKHFKSEIMCLFNSLVFEDHLLWMCQKGKESVVAGDIEKACRWLGFVQGALCTKGLASIDEMRSWNAPPEA